MSVSILHCEPSVSGCTDGLCVPKAAVNHFPQDFAERSVIRCGQPKTHLLILLILCKQLEENMMVNCSNLKTADVLWYDNMSL